MGKSLREMCRATYGEDFAEKYDMLNRGESIGSPTDIVIFVQMVERVRNTKQHAHWRYQTMTVPGGKGQTYAKWSCSACKGKQKKRSRYCPNCGAKMDGGQDDV